MVALGATACGGSPAPAPTPTPSITVDVAVEPTIAASTAEGLKIIAIDPAQGDVDGGTYAVIKGERFIADGPRSAKIYFGTRPGTIVRFKSDGELIVQAPTGTLNEVVDVTLVFEPGGKLRLAHAFTFVTRVP